jgi:hypothetical protein
MNKLLKNMQNKVKHLSGAIEMAKNLQKGEVIQLNGIHKIKVRAKDPSLLQQTINDLLQEQQGLIVRIERMGGEVSFN